MITKRTETYLTFSYAGSFVAETTRVRTLSTDPALISWPDGAYSVRFSQREVIDHEGVLFVGKETDVSKILYRPGSTIKTLDEIKALGNPRDEILISNMECNGWPSMIFTCFGNWPQPYYAEKMEILK